MPNTSMTLAKVAGVATDAAGVPLANTKLRVRAGADISRVYGTSSPTSLLSASGEVYTSATGEYSFYVLLGRPVSITAYDNQGTVLYYAAAVQPGVTVTPASRESGLGSALAQADYLDPRRYMVRSRLVTYGASREPIAAPGDRGAVYAFPASAVNGAGITLNEQQRDTTLLADTTSVSPKVLPFSTPRGAFLTTGANVNAVVITQD